MFLHFNALEAVDREEGPVRLVVFVLLVGHSTRIRRR